MGKKRVLVLGSKGLLGTVLIKKLVQNSTLTIFSHSQSAQADFSQDLFSLDSVTDLLKVSAADVVVNLFALTDVNLCESDKEKALQFNFKPVENIVKSIKDNKLTTQLIQISTDHLYNKLNAKEDDVEIVNYYAQSKYVADIESQKINATVLRTNFFGRSESSKQSFSDWIIKSLEDKKPLTGFQDVFFNPLNMQTLVHEIERVVMEPQPGIFNLGSRSGTSKYEFMVQLARHKGFNPEVVKAIDYKSANQSVSRPLEMRMDVSKYESTFKIQLPTLDQEIHKC